MRLKGGQFTRTYRKPTPEEIKARLEKEEEERKKRHEEYRKKYNIPPDVLLPDNFLPLIRLTNPQLIRNKIRFLPSFLKKHQKVIPQIFTTLQSHQTPGKKYLV